MGGATRVMTLLTAPLPPLRPSFILLHRRLSSLPATSLRLITLSSPPKIKTKARAPQLVGAFHSQPSTNTYPLHSSGAQQQQHHHHPWLEWTQFLNILSNGQGFSAPEEQGILPEDAFVVYEELPDDFVRAAAACIAFARARPNLLGMLSRRDIEAVVSNGTPFLFKSALDTARRMRAFLEPDKTNMSEFDRANTVDLMKYILSYASNPTVSSERSGLYSRELVDSSVRNLLHELGVICCGVPTGNTGHQFSGREGQIPRPFGQNIQMKRGDWICLKCNFMNFARNMKCLECEEPRPKRQLTSGEWECPQCTFFNYGRNVVCLRCDCRRPGAPLFNNNNSQSGLGYNGNYAYATNLENRSAGNEEKAQQWFNKIYQLNNAKDTNSAPDTSNSRSPDRILGQSTTVPERDDDNAGQIDVQNKDKDQAEKSERWFQKMAELHNVKDLPSAVSDDDFPEIMPMRKGENRFVVNKKKDRSLTSPKYKRQVAMDQTNNTNFVPFVPFPPGYFARKDTEQPGQGAPASTTPMKDQETMSSVSTQPMSSNPQSSSAHMAPPAETTVQNMTVQSSTSRPMNSNNENVGSSLEGSAVKEPDPLDMSEEAKAERWFKRVAQIKDISELSQIPDEDFPSIMPMRKGVNRFVVSKRKTPLERRLTSQQYRRNLPVVSTDSVKKESDNS